jgi:hypothetical protein
MFKLGHDSIRIGFTPQLECVKGHFFFKSLVVKIA